MIVSYVLEEIGERDQDRIINDSSADSLRHKRLNFLKIENDFTKTWAIDRKRDYYLLAVPRPSFAEADATPYYYFARGSMFLVRSQGGFGQNVYFDEEMLPPAPLRKEIEKEIRDAFRVYGRHGLGPKDHDPSILDVQFILKRGI